MERNIVLAALLHDIGKLLQRAENQQVYHGKIGCDYLKEKNFNNEILESTYYHHSKYLKTQNNFTNEFLTYLVYEADNLSSQHDRRKNLSEESDIEKWNKDSALKSITRSLFNSSCFTSLTVIRSCY